MSPQKPFKRFLKSWQLYLCILPVLVYLFIFNYLPMYGVQIAFRDFMPGLGITGSPWVGFAHFSAFLRSFQFPILIRNTLMINIYSLIFGFPIPIILALMLNEVRHLWYKKVIQNLTYIPFFITTVVIVSMIFLFTSPTTGVVNRIIGFFGVSPINFMGRSEWFRPLFVGSGIWQSMGFNSIIYIAALSGVDPELHEAACIDGANRIRRIWHINLPCIAPTIIMLLILNIGSLMSVGFERVFLMQNTLNLDVSEVISTYVYKVGLLGARFSFASAVDLFNTVINFTILLIVNRVAKTISGIAVL